MAPAMILHAFAGGVESSRNPIWQQLRGLLRRLYWSLLWISLMFGKLKWNFTLMAIYFKLTLKAGNMLQSPLKGLLIQGLCLITVDLGKMQELEQASRKKEQV